MKQIHNKKHFTSLFFIQNLWFLESTILKKVTLICSGNALILLNLLFTAASYSLLDVKYAKSKWHHVWNMKPQPLLEAFLESEHANYYTTEAL